MPIFAAKNTKTNKLRIRVDYNSVVSGNPWRHADIFEVGILIKPFPEVSGTLGLVYCSRFGLKRSLVQTPSSLKDKRGQ
jgi:hypothetical protein